jgi:hypothetical protein
VHIRFPSGHEYLRPATPPKFFLETSISSIDLLLRHHPENICFGHFGISDNAVYWLTSHRAQLLLWKDVIRDELKNVGEESFFTDCIERLKREDPRLACFQELTPDQQGRETYFMTNSIKGYVGYLQSA